MEYKNYFNFHIIVKTCFAKVWSVFGNSPRLLRSWMGCSVKSLKVHFTVIWLTFFFLFQYHVYWCEWHEPTITVLSYCVRIMIMRDIIWFCCLSDLVLSFEKVTHLTDLIFTLWPYECVFLSSVYRSPSRIFSSAGLVMAINSFTLCLPQNVPLYSRRTTLLVIVSFTSRLLKFLLTNVLLLR